MQKKEVLYRCGFTTGACAQAAAKAAAFMLANGKIIDSIDIELPNKEVHSFAVINQKLEKDSVSCGVIKDSGDDKQDVTDGIEICVQVKRIDGGEIKLTAGPGVGVVTLPGLAVACGEPAINPVPRQMIVRDVGDIFSEGEGFCVEISAAGGNEIAEKTYNPRLGIRGGISIIGTRGTVVPKSQEAYKATICLAIGVASGRRSSGICLVAGNIGERLLREKYLIPDENIVMVGDYVGFSLEQCLKKGISNVIYVGHIGKAVKVAAGLFNTHYSFGDARLETIAAYAAAQGGKGELINRILKLKLAEASIELLKNNGLMPVFDRIAKVASGRLQEMCAKKINIEILILSLSGEVIGSYPKVKANKIWQKYQ